LRSEAIARLSLLTMYAIFLISAAISLIGLVRVVFFDWTPPEIYFYAFVVSVAEPVGFLVLWTKNIFGIRTGIKVKTYANDQEINNYMKNLISSGSTLDIVSGRLHWVSEDESVKQRIIERARTAEINVYIAEGNPIASELGQSGIHVHIVHSLRGAPHARFTLVDKGRPGAAMLAVGTGRIPSFSISEFHEKSHPQVVALARDYIERLREGEKNA